MNVAFCIRKDYLSRQGGDTVQMLLTKDVLEKEYNIDSQIICDPKIITKGCADICHIFNLQTVNETAAFIDKCNAIGAKIVLSTITWDYEVARTYQQMTRYGIYNINNIYLLLANRILRTIASITGRPFGFSDKYSEYISNVVKKVDLLLPNSLEELKVLGRVCGISFDDLQKKSKVVYNGVSLNNENVIKVKEQYLPNNYILEVARIEPLKNQLMVIRAFQKDKSIPIVFVGDQRTDVKYFKQVQKTAKVRGNVYFINEVQHQEIGHYYKNALIHVLPSFAETTGIVSLEALSYGCPAVVSIRPYCPVDTYFAGFATTANPCDPSSIRAAVYNELNMKRDMAEISRDVMNKFNWNAAAKQTFYAYSSLVNK